MNYNEKPNNDDVFIRREMEFLVRLDIKPEVLKILKENFKVTEKIVIEPLEK